MNVLKLILITIFTLICLSCKSNENETYWEIKDIYREDKKPFNGLTDVLMKEIYTRNFHFIKKNDSLFFELPEKFEISLKNFKSLQQLNLFNKDYFVMYDYKFQGDTFMIRFKDNSTSSDSKNTIIEFNKISKKEFENDIHQVKDQRNKMELKMNAYKNELDKHPQIILNPVQKLPLKSETVLNDKGDKISFNIPKEITLKESGDIKNEKFSQIQVGTFRGNSKIYDIEHKEYDYGVKQLTIWISTDSSTFSIEDYISKKPNLKIYKKEKNSIVGYDIGYDRKNGEAVINSFFILKYYRTKGSHIFMYADVQRSQMKNFPNHEEMNKILNFNYLLSENISMKE